MLSIVLAAQLLPQALIGPNPGGFRVRTERDASRRLDGAPRPIQVALWYPGRSAPDGSGEPLRFGDYIGLAGAEKSTTLSPGAAAQANGVSHFLMLDKPGEFAERLDGFLAKLDAMPARR